MSLYAVLKVNDEAQSFDFVANVEAANAKAAVANGAVEAGEHVAVPAKSLNVFVAKEVDRPKFQVSGGGGS